MMGYYQYNLLSAHDLITTRSIVVIRIVIAKSKESYDLKVNNFVHFFLIVNKFAPLVH